jgi:tetratricopeptide (TPR) repeat protein
LRLSEILGGLPLAHEQAAAYCERLGIPLAKYIDKFNAEPARYLDDVGAAPAEYHNGLTVARTFALAIEEAAKLHFAAEPLITYAALLAPAPIPLFLFSEANQHFGEPLSALASDGLDEAVAALRHFALVSRDPMPTERDSATVVDCIYLHRLVRKIALEKAKSQKPDFLRRVIAALSRAFPDNGYSEPGSWPNCRLLFEHGMMLCEEARELGVESEELAVLLDALANYQNGIAAYRIVEPLYLEAVRIGKKLLSPNHSLVGVWLNNLGNLLLNMGRYYEAEPIYREAIAVGEATLGKESVGVATRKNNLAILLTDTKRYEEAEALFNESILITERTLGRQHPTMGTRLFNLGNLCRVTRQFEKAEAIYSEAIAIGEKHLGRKDARVSTRIANLADVFRDTGRLEEAECLYGEAINDLRHSLGEMHPSTAGVRHAYAVFLLLKDRVPEALSHAKLALRTYEQIYGDRNKWTLDTARIVVSASLQLGDFDEANVFRQKYPINST